jgi:hypothetical protein
VEIDGQKIATETGRMERQFLRDGTQHRMHITNPGYESMSVMFKDEPPLENVELVKLPTPSPAEAPAAPTTPVAKAAPPHPAPKVRPKPVEEKPHGRGANDAPILR